MSNTFITPEKNDNFAFLRGIDLQELLIETENYLLEYRNTLNLSKDITFGVELEYEGVRKSVINKFIKNRLSDWNSKGDGSLNSGGEVASPIMTDEEKYWQELKQICDYLTKRNADTFHNAGGHIHIGACVLGENIEVWKYFLKLYTAYESVLFRFMYGDKMSGRRKLFKYAPPIASEIHKNLYDINEIKKVSGLCYFLPATTRYAALNFCNVTFSKPELRDIKNTLEFRGPNASTSAVIWQNNINGFTKMLVASKDKVMDEEFLDYKLKHEYFPYEDNEYLYNEVCLKNVLEFVDLVFDNNLDKIIF